MPAMIATGGNTNVHDAVSIMRTFTCLLMMISMLLLAACGSQPIRRPATYIVKPGDTLYSIAWRNGVDYHELARFNHIGSDFRINAGQVLRFPGRGAMHQSPVVTARSAASAPASSPMPVSHIDWRWPASSNDYSLTTRPNGGKGLVINGITGQNIVAAAAGKVVYAGTGLLGYGQLLIIKHDESFLSAYGHTQSLYVHEGDAVSAGQKIASMGTGPDGTPQLYFEIRSNGRPLSPLSLLPQQK